MAVSGDGVTVRGARELRASLKRAGEGLQDLKDAHQAVADVVVVEARRRAPKRSGALAESIRAGKGATRATIRAGRARVKYAEVMEWGWPKRGIPAHHYVSGAVLDTRPQWMAVYEDAIQVILDKVEGA